MSDDTLTNAEREAVVLRAELAAAVIGNAANWPPALCAARRAE